MLKILFVAVGLSILTPAFAMAHEADRFTIRCLTSDVKDLCEASADKFRELYEKAYTGDLQARRNVAGMLQAGSSGVQKDLLSACSWRMIIATSKSRLVDDSDLSDMHLVCEKLTPQQIFQARTQASTLARRMMMKDPMDRQVIDADGL